MYAQESFDLLGDATNMSNGVYQLTPSDRNQAGLIINLFPIDLTQPFSKTFELNFGHDYGADGMTFSFLNGCSVKATVGADLGMSGITESLFVEFDTFQNGDLGDPVADHMAIMSRGDTDHRSTDAITTPIEMSNIEDQTYHEVKVTWTPNRDNTQTFEVVFTHSNGTIYTRSATRNFIEDIFSGNSIVFWGFSASTGNDVNSQRVRIQEEDRNRTEKYICKGDTSTLEAPQKGTNYSWTSNPSTTIRGNTNPSISVSPLETTEYTCIYKSYCQTIDTVKYKVYVPKFSEKHVDLTCNQQGSVTLLVKDGKAPYTYTLDGILKQSNIDTCRFNNLSAGDHSYIIETSNGCSESSSITLKKSPPPSTPEVQQNQQSYCSGETRPALEVNNPDTMNYTYTWYHGSTRINEGVRLNYNQLSDPSIISGSFTVKATDNTTGCESESTEVTLTQNVTPAPSADNQSYCSGEARPALEVNNPDTMNYTYTWYHGSTRINEGVRLNYNQLNDPSIISGSFTVKATDNTTGCESESTEVTLTQNALPDAPSADNQSYCSGEARPALEVNNPNILNYTYTWYQGSTMINEGVRLNYNQLSPSMTSGSFTVTAADKITGCISPAAAVELIQLPKPNVSVSANYPILFYGQTLELHSDISSAPSMFSWKGPNGFRSQQENPVIPSVQAKHSGTYQVTLINEKTGCSAVNQLDIKVYIDVETALGQDVVLCPDGETSVTFSYPQRSGLTYRWAGPKGFSSNENQIMVTEVGVYTLTVTTSDGNKSVGSVRIRASDLSLQKVNTCLAQTIVKPSGGHPPYAYSLDGITFQSSPIFKGDFIRAHTVYVRDSNGCEVREEAKGFRFDLYGAFSPNGDGINDRWDLSDLSGCVKVRVKLFDRYGRYLHQMEVKNLSWDGRVKGKALPSGTYWYVIEFNDGVTPVLKGNLTIKRRKD